MIMERTRDVKKRIANLPFPKRRRAQSKLKALKKQLVKRKQ
jgi:hypothetical protein